MFVMKRGRRFDEWKLPPACVEEICHRMDFVTVDRRPRLALERRGANLEHRALTWARVGGLRPPRRTNASPLRERGRPYVWIT